MGNIWKIIITAVLGLLFSLLLIEKIDLTTADLGRHIKNGEVILIGSWQDKWGVLTTNFYSFSQPDRNFVNHHWGSGVIFYALQRSFGFTGLSIVYLILSLFAFGLFFLSAKRQGGWFWTVVCALPALPLMAYRGELRPEIFTYLLSGFFYFFLWQWHKGKLSHKQLLVLPVLMIAWVNLHIGFVFGLFLIGAFGLDQLIKKLRKKPNGFIALLFIGILSAAACLVNPNFIKGLLYPFNIFRQYGYNIVENQSIFAIHRLGIGSSVPLISFYLSLGILILSFGVIYAGNRQKASVVNLVIALALTALAVFGLRHFTIFALFTLPIVVRNFSLGLKSVGHKAYEFLFYILSLLLILSSLFLIYKDINAKKDILGFGLMPGSELSYEFLKRNNIQGPIFNNYDVGGYLIYGLDSHQPVFVDNRPEAYTVSFFEDTYIPMQQGEAKWEQADKEFNFNAIFFSHRDFTPWAQDFLIARLGDQDWAAVYADNFNIIFLKKNSQNIGLIQKYYIPPEYFQVVPY